MSKTILVTGATGYIGSRLVASLLSDGNRVLGLCRHENQKFEQFSKNFKFVKCDISKTNSVDQAFTLMSFERINIVIHLAADLHSTKNESIFDCNVNGTQNVLNLALKLKAKKFVFASSVMAIGPLKITDVPADENHICSPISPYGVSKLEAEKKLLSQGDLSVAILRLGYVYGPGNPSIMAPLFDKTRKGQIDFLYKFKPYRNEGPEQILQFIHVDDAVKSFSGICKEKEISGIFHVVHKEYKTRKQLALLLSPFKIPNGSFNSMFWYKIIFVIKKIRRRVTNRYDFKRIHWAYKNSESKKMKFFNAQFTLEAGVASINSRK